MMKFMAMYMAPAAAIETMMKATPEQMKAGMDAWMGWANRNKAMIVDLGAPLGKTRRVTAGGAMADTKNEITGYSIVQGESREAVAKMFKDHPHLQLKGASIDLLDWVTMPGM